MPCRLAGHDYSINNPIRCRLVDLEILEMTKKPRELMDPWKGMSRLHSTRFTAYIR